MEKPTPPQAASPAVTDADIDATLAAWADLRQQLQELHARLEYLGLILRLKVRLP